jgi:hypothetical protein
MRCGLFTFLATLELLCFGACVRAGYGEERKRQNGARSDAGFGVDGGGLFGFDGSGLGLFAIGRYPFGSGDSQATGTGAYVLTDAGIEEALDAVSPSPDAEPPDAAAPAEPMLGTWWVAQLTDDVGVAYSACMTVTQVTRPGIMAGQIVYADGLDCSGYIVFQQLAGGVYTFDENIDAGANQSYCRVGGGGRMETTLLTDDSMAWQWHRRTGTNILAEAQLARVTGCP